MKKTMKAALAATLALGLGQVAQADLSLNGAVGLPLNPTAQVPDAGGVRLQGNYYDGGDAGAGNTKYMGLVAAGSLSPNLEISGGMTRLSGAGAGVDKTGVAIGAKYLFTRESDPAGVRLAVGAGYAQAMLRNTHAYAVATKHIAMGDDKLPLTGSLGLRYDAWDLVPGAPGGKDNKLSIFAGAEVPLSRTGDVHFVAELGSKNATGASSPYSVGLRYRPAGRPFGASVGYQRQGVFSTGGLYAQIGYTWATGAGK